MGPISFSVTNHWKEYQHQQVVLREPDIPGLYHFTYEALDEQSRIHLRIDPDGNGILLINANKVMHLNPTAVMMARFSLEKIPEQKAIRALTNKYQIKKSEAQLDYRQFCDQLNKLVRPNGPCPIHELELETTAPFSARPSAPYRMDLALTYRCNNDCFHCYNARPRDFYEMDTTSWKAVIDHLWDLGIPHIVFTGGEPTLRTDLPELINYAENKGQITGLNTNGRRLSDKRFVEQLLNAGLDHVQITLESHKPEIHDQMVNLNGAWHQTIDGIRNVLNTPLYVMTNTTMLTANSPHMEDTLLFLAELGVPTVGLNALIYAGKGKTVGTGLAEEKLHSLLTPARRITDANQQRLIWYTPTQYCNFDPMELELGVKGCTAALYNMCVEPDGAVIPCQSFYHPLGKLLDDPWDSIWNHDLAIGLRERYFIQGKCKDCILLPECGGSCPLLTGTYNNK